MGVSSCMKISNLPEQCDVRSLENHIEESYLHERAEPELLSLDLHKCLFIDAPALAWLVAFVCRRRQRGFKTELILPENNNVRSFMMVWEFPRAVREGSGVDFFDFVSRESADYYLSNLWHDVTKSSYAKTITDADGIEQRLVSEGFFEITSFFPPVGVVKYRLAEKENARWKDDRIISVLNRRLKRPSDTIASHIVHEAMMNALRHPMCKVVQTASQFQRPKSFKLSNRYGISNWRKLLSELVRVSDDTAPSPVKRVWELLPEKTKESLRRTETPPMKKDFADEVKDALNKMIESKNFYKPEYFSCFNDVLGLSEYSNESRSSQESPESLNRKLLELTFSGLVKKIPRGHFTLVYWDDGESIVDTLFNSLKDGYRVTRKDSESLFRDLFSTYKVQVVDARNSIKDQYSIDTDFIPGEGSTAEEILLASTFPGITRDVRGIGHKASPEIYKDDERLALPGMGLYVLTREAVKVFGGSFTIRTKNYLLHVYGFNPGKPNSEPECYSVRIREYSQRLPFRGNLLTIRLPLG